jgi:hypothetical protein
MSWANVSGKLTGRKGRVAASNTPPVDEALMAEIAHKIQSSPRTEIMEGYNFDNKKRCFYKNCNGPLVETPFWFIGREWWICKQHDNKLGHSQEKRDNDVMRGIIRAMDQLYTINLWMAENMSEQLNKERKWLRQMEEGVRIRIMAVAKCNQLGMKAMLEDEVGKRRDNAEKRRVIQSLSDTPVPKDAQILPPPVQKDAQILPPPVQKEVSKTKTGGVGTGKNTRGARVAKKPRSENMSQAESEESDSENESIATVIESTGQGIPSNVTLGKRTFAEAAQGAQGQEGDDETQEDEDMEEQGEMNIENTPFSGVQKFLDLKHPPYNVICVKRKAGPEEVEREDRFINKQTWTQIWSSANNELALIQHRKIKEKRRVAKENNEVYIPNNLENLDEETVWQKFRNGIGYIVVMTPEADQLVKRALHECDMGKWTNAERQEMRLRPSVADWGDTHLPVRMTLFIPETLGNEMTKKFDQIAMEMIVFKLPIHERGKYTRPYMQKVKKGKLFTMTITDDLREDIENWLDEGHCVFVCLSCQSRYIDTSKRENPF